VKRSEERNGLAAEPVRVMLATADPHLRLVVAQELAADRRTDLVAQPGCLAEARWRMSETRFDVLLVDIRLDHVLKLIGLRCALQCKVDVIVICATDDEDAAVQAFNAGAAGCIARNAWFGRFVQAVLEVANGGAVLPQSLARRLLRPHDLPAPVAAVRGSAAAPSPPLSHLSHRETEVLAMVAGGLRTREIGQQLTISGDTVNAHIKSIYHKLHVRSRAQAVRIATQDGLF
jgi:DNA-binding NarL/FixJ family response regulator